MEKQKQKQIKYKNAISNKESVRLSFSLDTSRLKERMALEKLIDYMDFFGVNTREAFVDLLVDNQAQAQAYQYQNDKNNLNYNILQEDLQEKENINNNNIDEEKVTQQKNDNNQNLEYLREALLEQYK